MRRSAFFSLTTVALVLGLVLPGCSALKDPEPWTATVSFSDGANGALVITPSTIEGDSAFGQIQVVNDTQIKRGFEVDGLAVYERNIPAGQSKQIDIFEAKDKTTYTFDDLLHPKAGSGKIVITYLAENLRG